MFVHPVLSWYLILVNKVCWFIELDLERVGKQKRTKYEIIVQHFTLLSTELKFWLLAGCFKFNDFQLNCESFSG